MMQKDYAFVDRLCKSNQCLNWDILRVIFQLIKYFINQHMKEQFLSRNPSENFNVFLKLFIFKLQEKAMNWLNCNQKCLPYHYQFFYIYRYIHQIPSNFRMLHSGVMPTDHMHGTNKHSKSPLFDEQQLIRRMFVNQINSLRDDYQSQAAIAKCMEKSNLIIKEQNEKEDKRSRQEFYIISKRQLSNVENYIQIRPYRYHKLLNNIFKIGLVSRYNPIKTLFGVFQTEIITLLKLINQTYELKDKQPILNTSWIINTMQFIYGSCKMDELLLAFLNIIWFQLDNALQIAVGKVCPVSHYGYLIKEMDVGIFNAVGNKHKVFKIQAEL